MHPHGPDPLVGPLRGTTAWWHGRSADEPDLADDSPAPQEPPAAPPRTRKRGPRKIRTELVERVRAEIAAGTYDTPDKFQAALERLLERMWD
jgi:negative regulator of flagellin synthesis FlgM